jgi:ADP-L-glycero-D-manno-heptose 6-epimerase
MGAPEASCQGLGNRAAGAQEPSTLSERTAVIIVTGGAGFIGSALIWRLNQLGESDILVVDSLGDDEKWKNLNGLRFVDYIEKETFLDLVLSTKLDGGIDTIFHLGACSSTTETDASYLIRNNFEYSKHLAQFALAREIRFIYASSAATYGDGALGYSDREELLETLRPLNMYGYSKQLFDLWAQRQGLLRRIVGLKYFNVFGPNEHHKGEMRSLVCKGFQQIQQTSALRLFRSYRPDYADGEQRRDFLYVKDAIDMTLFFHERREPCGIFNVGSAEAHTWNELAEHLFAAMEQPRRVEYVDMPEALREKYQYHTCADLQKLRRAGCSRPLTPLRDAVRDYVRQYLLPARHLASPPTA